MVNRVSWQVFEGDLVVLSCKAANCTGRTWSVWMDTGHGMTQCGAGRGDVYWSECWLTVARTDSGIYFCFSSDGYYGEDSILTVATAESVVMDVSPALVADGNDVVLRCTLASADVLGDEPALFYKNNVLIATLPRGYMLIRNFSDDRDGGYYACALPGRGESRHEFLATEDDIDVCAMYDPDVEVPGAAPPIAAPPIATPPVATPPTVMPPKQQGAGIAIVIGLSLICAMYLIVWITMYLIPRLRTGANEHTMTTRRRTACRYITYSNHATKATEACRYITYSNHATKATESDICVVFDSVDNDGLDDVEVTGAAPPIATPPVATSPTATTPPKQQLSEGADMPIVPSLICAVFLIVWTRMNLTPRLRAGPDEEHAMTTRRHTTYSNHATKATKSDICGVFDNVDNDGLDTEVESPGLYEEYAMLSM